MNQLIAYLRFQCDETGPPCGPCPSRQIHCAYSQSSATDDSSTLDGGSITLSVTPTPVLDGRSNTLSVTPTPSGLRSSHQSNILELELMHQWSTPTYKAMCGEIVEEFPSWQIIIPQESLQHTFLLYGLLALASLEIAVLDKRRDNAIYTRVSLEYHTSALQAFRSELTDVTPEKEQAILAFSILIMVLSLALSKVTKDHEEPQSTLRNMLAQFGLVQGVQALTRQHWDNLRKTPLFHNIRIEQRQASPLENGIKEAITRLNDLNDARANPISNQTRASKLQTITYHAACRKAIFYLEDYFGRCKDPYGKGLTLGWLTVSGADYVAAVENADPVAYLIYMHWGLLAEKCSDAFWWAESVGRILVDEISLLLANDTDPVLKASVSWARGEVGL